MSSAALTYMLEQMNRYFELVRALVGPGGSAEMSSFKYLSGEVQNNGSVVINAPALLGYNTTTFNIYSIGIELRMEDPTYSGVRIVDATSTLSPSIGSDGKITIWNNYDQPIKYHLRITMPVRK